jgi:hypothetical protein
LAVAGANRPAMKLGKDTADSVVAKRPRTTQKWPQGMCLDKGYDYEEVREKLREFDFTAHMRARRKQAQTLKRHVRFKVRG